MNYQKSIFKNGSITYYYSSIFFPKKIRIAVATLYAFVRTADNYVDAIPQQVIQFKQFQTESIAALQGVKSQNPVIAPFIDLVAEYELNKEWIIAFLKAMSADLNKNIYMSFQELEEYMYGSAEVIGLMMARLMELPEKAYESARIQGKAMQLLNFIRDIKEDLELGRQYIPDSDLKKTGVLTLSPTDHNIGILITEEINRFFALQQKAEKGYKYIPKKYLVSIKTAADIYIWTAKKILKDPLVVFRKKIKPAPLYVFGLY